MKIQKINSIRDLEKSALTEEERKKYQNEIEQEEKKEIVLSDYE